ncbi:MAG: hypothetical protein U1E81_12395 [Xanthobacteraceae bacterium]
MNKFVTMIGVGAIGHFAVSDFAAALGNKDNPVPQPPVAGFAAGPALATTSSTTTTIAFVMNAVTDEGNEIVPPAWPGLSGILLK